MSVSSIIGTDGKLVESVLPDPYPFPASAGLGAVLAINNSAANPTTGQEQPIFDVSTMSASLVTAPFGTIQSFGASLIEDAGGLGNIGIVPANNLSLLPQNDLIIKGAQAKGSLLVGDGTKTIELPVGANNGLVLKINSGTTSGLEWGTDASGGSVVAVNAGTNINVGGTIAQPIVNLAAPLTSTLGMGSVALTDKNAASGTAGQFLSAGTGGETEWATPPDTLPTISAGNNISVSGTQVSPTIALQNPLTADLALGGVNMTAGTLAGANSTTNATGVVYQSGGISGGPQLANYQSTFFNVIDLAGGGSGKKVEASGSQGLTITDATIGTSTRDNKIEAQQYRMRNIDNIGTGISQITILPQALQYANTDSQVSPTFTDTSTYDNCSRMATSLDDSNGNNSTRTETISRTLGSNQVLQYNDPATNFLQSTQTFTTNNTGCVYTGVSEQLIGSGVNQLGTFSGSSQIGQAELSTSYQNLTSGALYQSTAGYLTNGGGASSTLTSANLSASQSHLLRLECPSSGNARLEHTSLGVVKDLDITTNGKLSMTTGQQGFLIQGNPINLTAVAGNVSGQLIKSGLVHINRTTAVSNISAPSYLFQNENASNASFPVIQLARPVPASVAGDTLGAISFFGDDAGGGASREWARIQTKAENVTGGNQDGTLSIFTSVNGTISEVANYNGAQNENNTFRPFDLNNNDIRTSTGNILLTGTLSSGAGTIELKTKDATAGAGTGLILTGNTLTSGSAGGNSGQHLCLTINGAVFKIALLNP